MSRICAICGKKSIVTVTRKKSKSKYNPTSKKRKYPNLQWVKLVNGKRVRVCTKCIKKLGKK
ncbi:MAG: 50S ribosomal protein L28 [Candidatus Portnoybacteria bacterium CG10_big_fil_rev_8_21_14_0_10_38_18]|uniref:50S ribosomal protein L28 n=1 Tax=Candidatus Portnoybacteria bacterium CG10_big_fil_rev_8_21_14_0_10_38_18 TaxID=1974813 RepID=A0A2M8KCK0_9BACT|nr:MAG: 50S ribosomal protein L28 [Candidatus Portnoybacteria bacterium CG10_big_fil_rev_8_21_14_0_10_38_18]